MLWSIMWCCLHPLHVTFLKRIKRTVCWPADNSSPLRECAPRKVIRVSPESEKRLLVESKIPGFGICGSAQWIRNPDNYWKQDPKYHWKGGGGRSSRPWDEGGRGGAVSKNFFSALQASAPSLDPPLLITTAQLTRNYRSPGHSDLLHFTTCVSTPYALTLPPHALRFPEL